jgi:predicted Zn-dependent protease
MRKCYRSGWIALCIASCLWLSCSTVPVSGRKQLNLVPDSTMLPMSFQQYDEFLKTHQLSTNRQQTEEVKRVGRRVQGAVERYFAENQMSDELRGYVWEFNLVKSPEVNAWCMPGGKVVVYEGIMPIAKDDAGLAVVMGHEIAHAVAKHGNERMSQQLAVQMGGMTLSTALSSQPAATQQVWMGLYGAGAQYGMVLPYSRVHESEADHLGLIFMAMAGYDPHQAIGFWERMAAQKQGGEPPEFMSTHPASATRIRNIKKLIPQVMPYYEKSSQR